MRLTTLRWAFIIFFSAHNLFVLRGLAQYPEAEKALLDVLDTLIGIDKVFRTSDLDGEVPTSSRLRREKLGTKADGKPASPRIGCICMDYAIRSTISTGSCAGHGGVRFWLYVGENGDTLKRATWRHQEHPDTLQEGELWKLAAYQRWQRMQLDKQEASRQIVEIRFDSSLMNAQPRFDNGATGTPQAPQVVYITPQSAPSESGTMTDKALALSIVSVGAALTGFIVKFLLKDEIKDDVKDEAKDRSVPNEAAPPSASASTDETHE